MRVEENEKIRFKTQKIFRSITIYPQATKPHKTQANALKGVIQRDDGMKKVMDVKSTTLFYYFSGISNLKVRSHGNSGLPKCP